MKIKDIVSESYKGYSGRIKDFGSVKHGIDQSIPNARIEPEVRNTDTCISTEKKRDRRTLPSRKTQPAVMARIRGFNTFGRGKNLTRMFEGVAEQVTQTTKASPLKTATTTKVIQN